MDKFNFKHAVYKDVKTDFATRASFGKGTVEINAFNNGSDKAWFEITLNTANSKVSILCQDYEIENPGDGVVGIYLYFGHEIQGEIFLS